MARESWPCLDCGALLGPVFTPTRWPGKLALNGWTRKRCDPCQEARVKAWHAAYREKHTANVRRLRAGGPRICVTCPAPAQRDRRMCRSCRRGRAIEPLYVRPPNVRRGCPMPREEALRIYAAHVAEGPRR